jgi:hypothetical protein
MDLAVGCGVFTARLQLSNREGFSSKRTNYQIYIQFRGEMAEIDENPGSTLAQEGKFNSCGLSLCRFYLGWN